MTAPSVAAGSVANAKASAADSKVSNRTEVEKAAEPAPRLFSGSAESVTDSDTSELSSMSRVTVPPSPRLSSRAAGDELPDQPPPPPPPPHPSSVSDDVLEEEDDPDLLDVSAEEMDEESVTASYEDEDRMSIVTRLLETVESQEGQGANCTPGTELNLGVKVVNRYAQERFHGAAMVNAYLDGNVTDWPLLSVRDTTLIGQFTDFH